VTIMLMDTGIDTGPVLSQKAIPILPDDTSASLSGRLAELGAKLLGETLPAYLSGKIKPQPQDEFSKEQPSYAPMLKKEDGLLDFNQEASELERRVRAFNPWPGAFIAWQGQNLKIINAHVVEQPFSSLGVSDPPGQPIVYQGLPAIITRRGLLVVDELQPAGKKPMAGAVYLRGARLWGK
jgi:methionyl-tRNA formyltransferase